jgi:hypothetical protein
MLPFAGPSALRAAKAEASVTCRLAPATDVARGPSGATNVAGFAPVVGPASLGSGPLAESSCGESCLFGFRSTGRSEGGSGRNSCCLRFLFYLSLGAWALFLLTLAERLWRTPELIVSLGSCTRVALWRPCGKDDGVGPTAWTVRVVVCL